MFPLIERSGHFQNKSNISNLEFLDNSKHGILYHSSILISHVKSPWSTDLLKVFWRPFQRLAGVRTICIIIIKSTNLYLPTKFGKWRRVQVNFVRVLSSQRGGEANFVAVLYHHQVFSVKFWKSKIQSQSDLRLHLLSYHPDIIIASFIVIIFMGRMGSLCYQPGAFYEPQFYSRTPQPLIS